MNSSPVTRRAYTEAQKGLTQRGQQSQSLAGFHSCSNGCSLSFLPLNVTISHSINLCLQPLRNVSRVLKAFLCFSQENFSLKQMTDADSDGMKLCIICLMLDFVMLNYLQKFTFLWSHLDLVLRCVRPPKVPKSSHLQSSVISLHQCRCILSQI